MCLINELLLVKLLFPLIFRLFLLCCIVLYVILFCSAPLSSIVSGTTQIHFMIVIVCDGQEVLSSHSTSVKLDMPNLSSPGFFSNGVTRPHFREDRKTPSLNDKLTNHAISGAITSAADFNSDTGNGHLLMTWLHGKCRIN